MKLISITLLSLTIIPSSHAIRSTDFWNETTVTGTAPFQSLSSQCSKTCVQNVNQQINPPDGCDTYGCVCSENDPRGTNLIAAFNAVIACVRENCDGDSPVQAGSVFRSICSIAVNLVPTTTGPATSESISTKSVTSVEVVTRTVNGTPSTAVTTVVRSYTVSQTAPLIPTQTCSEGFINRITPPSYDDLLNGCSRFVVNGCRDGYGNYDELQCGPLKTPDGWQEYKGLSHALGACTAYDICPGPLFFIALSAAYNASATFCNYKPTVNGSVDADWDQIKGVVADYCARAKLGQDTWQHEVVGEDTSKGEIDKHRFSLGTSDIIAIAAALGGVVVTLLVGLPTIYFGYPTWKLAKEKRKERLAKGIALAAANKVKKP